MEQDLALLQNISDTLKDKPEASQRQLAKNANISLGMMNAILGRFVERGWIMLKNVNGRKLAYAVTPDGMVELTKRSRAFVKRTFAIANDYNEVLEKLITEAKNDGKESVVLYGKSYIKFLIAYICDKVGIEFEEVEINSKIKNESLCIVGEFEEDKNIEKQDYLPGAINLVDIIKSKRD